MGMTLRIPVSIRVIKDEREKARIMRRLIDIVKPEVHEEELPSTPANDREAIEYAIRCAQITPFRLVELGRGVYTVDKPIRIEGNVTIVGETTENKQGEQP